VEQDDVLKQCLCCGNKNFKIHTRDSYIGFPVFKCMDCGLYVSGNNEHEMKKRANQIYEKEYWDMEGSEEAIRSDYTNPRSLVLKKRWISQFDYAKPLMTNKKSILEIGSGGGQALFWFSQAGLTVLGIEPDKRNVDLINAKLGKNKICLNGTGEDFEVGEKFDVVWMSHVLEHTIRPDLVLKKIHHVLNDGGILMIEVPNCSNKKILDSSINENPSTFHYTKRSLLELGKRSGFEIIKSDFFISKRTFGELLLRMRQKYMNHLLGEAPFHFEVTSDENKGLYLRALFVKKN